MFSSNNGMQDSPVVHVPAGRYYVGDPCYAFSHGTNTWDRIGAATDWFETNATELQPGKWVGGFGTMWGDGEYNGFPVDAGLIGFVHEDLVEPGCTFLENPECGRWVVFAEAWVARAYHNGEIHIGHIVVDTNPGDEEQEEEPDYSEEDEDGDGE